MNRDSFLSVLRGHEGLRLFAYRDSRGVWTIGYGHTGPDVFEGQQITREEAERLLALDSDRAVASCRNNFEWFNFLDDTRQNAVCSMAFNVGMSGLMKFKKMLAAVAAKDFPEAANQMLCSVWASQVGPRATELAQMMRKGDTVH